MEVKLPELAEGVNEATISFWQKKVGDNVTEGEDLVEMVTDKAVFNLPAPTSGNLVKIIAQDGEVIKVGEVLAIIEAS